MSTTSVGVSKGQYKVLEYREVNFVGLRKDVFIEIKVGSRIGWIKNDTWPISEKTDDGQ